MTTPKYHRRDKDFKAPHADGSHRWWRWTRFSPLPLACSMEDHNIGQGDVFFWRNRADSRQYVCINHAAEAGVPGAMYEGEVIESANR